MEIKKTKNSEKRSTEMKYIANIINKKQQMLCAVLSAALLSVYLPGKVSAEVPEDFKKQMASYLADDANVEQVGNALERYFRKRRQQQEDQVADMEKQFESPMQVDIGDSPVRGKADAPITIVEFSDYQCPYCSRGAETMDEVLKNYPDQVKVVFKNLPLSFHQQAKPAAIAALAAGRQGKYWEMHDALFANQQRLGEEDKLFTELATKIGLNLEKFQKDIKDEVVAKQIEADLAQASKLSIFGTPGYFVNGVQVKGAQPFPQFKLVIDRWLEKLKKK